MSQRKTPARARRTARPTTDIVDAATRSRMMASVRSRDTAPELRVRRFLHAAGLRFRLHVRTVAGTPDLFFPRYRTALFVHGCFWHQHPGCPKAALPKANHAFWAAKLAANAERDRRTAAALTAGEVHVLTIWECETRSSDALHAVAAAVRAAPARQGNPVAP